MIKKRIKFQELSYGEVVLQDAYCVNALEKEKKYLEGLEPDRLLAGFRETAGLPEKAKRYPGWEVTEIQGHTQGHYLSAIAQVCAYEEHQEFQQRVSYIVQELQECQRADGYLFAWSEEIFDRVEHHEPAWVPWYTMHKIFEGLLLAYELAGEKKALSVLRKLGDWVCQRTDRWDEAMQRQVLSVEYGGMNDCLYELYQLTKEKRYQKAAHKFDELPLFQAMQEKRDVLNGLHANTTIPKIVGAFQAYCATGKTEYLKTAEHFFDMVLAHHTYITGGNSEWEHFGQPDILDAERTACNCETCNTYNMLKLAKGLFAVTGDKKYADFYERTWSNAILSSQNPDTGMTMYFQPMATGFFKVYSTPFDKFWCCTGTGMENFSKLHEGIYFRKDKAVYVNRFVSSKVRTKDGELAFELTADLPKDNVVCLKVEQGKDLELHIRIPEWQVGRLEISLQGKEEGTICYQEEKGYAVLTGVSAGEVLKITFSMEVRCESLPDNPASVAFAYGPVVLSAKLGTEKLDTTVTGVDVTVPKKEISLQDYLILQGCTVETFKKQIAEYLVKQEGVVAFGLKGTDLDGKLTFVPHFSQHKERYGIYWTLYEKDSKALEERRSLDRSRSSLEQEAVDIIPVGNDQYELSHGIRGYKTDIIRRVGFVCRFLTEDGWICYDMKTTEGKNLLYMKYSIHDSGRFQLYVNGGLLAEEDHGKENQAGFAADEAYFYQKSYELPEECSKHGKINLKLQNIEGSCKFYDEIYIQSQE